MSYTTFWNFSKFRRRRQLLTGSTDDPVVAVVIRIFTIVNVVAENVGQRMAGRSPFGQSQRELFDVPEARTARTISSEGRAIRTFGQKIPRRLERRSLTGSYVVDVVLSEEAVPKQLLGAESEENEFLVWRQPKPEDAVRSFHDGGWNEFATLLRNDAEKGESAPAVLVHVFAIRTPRAVPAF